MAESDLTNSFQQRNAHQFYSIEAHSSTIGPAPPAVVVLPIAESGTVGYGDVGLTFRQVVHVFVWAGNGVQRESQVAS